MYFDNVALMLNGRQYVFNAICAIGRQLEERWTVTPTAEEVGEYPLELIVVDDQNSVVARAAIRLRILSSSAGSTNAMTVLPIGDSFTAAEIYPRKLLQLAAQSHLRLQFIGSRTSTDGLIRHEGYGGWNARTFATDPASPFLVPASDDRRVDFRQYCDRTNGGQPPSVITILLGTNDVFLARDESVDEQLQQMIEHLEALITQFHRVGPSTVVGVIPPTPPAQSQDGFQNYFGDLRQTRWQYRRNQHRAVERLTEHFQGRERERIHLVPAYINLDTERCFRTSVAPANARAAVQVTRVEDGIHPTESGYAQIADSIFCWLMSLSSR
jgi:lysophospholipase L1-like esterase